MENKIAIATSEDGGVIDALILDFLMHYGDQLIEDKIEHTK